MTMQEDWGDVEQPKKSGMSTLAKVLLIFGILFGTCGLICCGGVVYFGYMITSSFKTAPADVDAIRNSIAEIQLPPQLKPVMGMDWTLVVVMKMTLYASKSTPAVKPAAEPANENEDAAAKDVGERDAGEQDAAVEGEKQAPANAPPVAETGEEVLMLMEFAGPGVEEKDNEQLKNEMMKNFEQQGGRGQKNIVVESSETREFEIRGEKACIFTFSKGKDPDDQTEKRQVNGSFKGKNGGVAILFYICDEAVWNEDVIVQMIESIK
jgi:hypothetical protein